MTGEEGAALTPGTIVQIGPNTVNQAFAFCLMVVHEVKPWGVQGYVQGLGADRETIGGRYYYRASWEEIEATGGQIVWGLDDPLGLADLQRR
jgi:hypothetical protein